jgi:hypothetical protein
VEIIVAPAPHGRFTFTTMIVIDVHAPRRNVSNRTTERF